MSMFYTYNWYGKEKEKGGGLPEIEVCALPLRTEGNFFNFHGH